MRKAPQKEGETLAELTKEALDFEGPQPGMRPEEPCSQ